MKNTVNLVKLTVPAQELNRIRNRLFSEIKDQVQDVMETTSSEERISVGNAIVIFDTSSNSRSYGGLVKSDSDEFGGASGWGAHNKQSSWDIVGHTKISIEQRVTHQTYTRCANIIFGRSSDDSEYRWYEISFWSLSNNKQKR